MEQTTDDIIAQALAECGWTTSCGVAVKSFRTAVGVKTAHAFLSSGDGFNRTLAGSYESEGSNVLSADAVLIPISACVTTVRHLAQRFAIQVDASVSSSYACRLFLLRMKRA